MVSLKDLRVCMMKADAKISLAQTYAQDGAYLSAAERMEEAASLLREYHALREAYIDGRARGGA